MTKLNAKARVTEVDAVSDALVRAYDAEAADGAVKKDVFLAGVMKDVRAYSADITDAIKADALSVSLEDADAKRDAAAKSLFALAVGYAAIPLPEKKAAGEKIKAVCDKFKAILTESYSNESSLIEALLSDLAKLTAEVEKLDGMAEAVAALRAAEDEFNAASDEATAAKTDKAASATALKKPLLAAINETLVPYLSAVGKTADYKDFAAKAGAEIDKVNAAIKARAKKA